MKQDIQISQFAECYGRHAHEYPQVLVPLQERLRIEVGNTEYEVSPRELCFIPANKKHECNHKGKLIALNLDTTSTTVAQKQFLTEPFVMSMQGQIIQLVQLIQTELRENPQSEAVRHLYLYFYSKLMEAWMPPSILYISNHYDTPITTERLAEIECYNVKYYNDWFKQKTGVSPGYYLRRLRIDRAKDLLEHTDFRMNEIAVMIGYSSNAAFTRAFRSLTGIAPENYRKECGRRMTG